MNLAGGLLIYTQRVYEGIIRGKGYGLEDARQAIEIVHEIRNSKPIGLKGDYHPFAERMSQTPFNKYKYENSCDYRCKATVYKTFCF